MMKAIIKFVEPLNWVKNDIGICNSALLPIVNKPLLEYYFDFFKKMGIDDVLVLNDIAQQSNYLCYKAKEKYGFKILHNIVNSCISPSEIKDRFNSYIEEDEMLYIETDMFIHWDKNLDNLYSLVQKGIDVVINSSINTTKLHVEQIKDLNSFYELNLKILKKYANNYCLPGYTGDSQIQLGSECHYDESTKLEGSCNLGNIVNLARGTEICDTIVGDFSVIGESCHLDETVILRDTVLGDNLFFKNKVIANGKVIDPKTGVVIEFDEVLKSNNVLKTFTSLLKSVLTKVIAISLLTIKLPVFYLFHLNKDFRTGCSTSKVITNSLFEDVSVWNNCHKFRNSTIFYSLGLDKVPLLIAVLRGQIRMVGKNIENEFDRESGVYSFSEVLAKGGKISAYTAIDDSYYEYKRSFFSDIKLVFSFYIMRTRGGGNGRL